MSDACPTSTSPEFPRCKVFASSFLFNRRAAKIRIANDT